MSRCDSIMCSNLNDSVLRDSDGLVQGTLAISARVHMYITRGYTCSDTLQLNLQSSPRSRIVALPAHGLLYLSMGYIFSIFMHHPILTFSTYKSVFQIAVSRFFRFILTIYNTWSKVWQWALVTYSISLYIFY